MIRFAILHFFIFFFQDYVLAASPHIQNLRCEYLDSPIGIDAKHPRFSWVLLDDNPGVSQSSFQIITGTDSIAVAHNKGDMWQSPFVPGRTTLIPYAGRPLHPFTKYYWTVISKNNNQISRSPVAYFETGMMDAKNWKGAWISDDAGTDVKPAPFFRRAITVS